MGKREEKFKKDKALNHRNHQNSYLDYSTTNSSNFT